MRRGRIGPLNIVVMVVVAATAAMIVVLELSHLRLFPIVVCCKRRGTDNSKVARSVIVVVPRWMVGR